MNQLAKESSSAAWLGRCLDCGIPLRGESVCQSCRHSYPTKNGIFEAIRPLHGCNCVAAAFYDGPTWSKFRFWEDLFLRVVGGKTKARRQILSHLPIGNPNARVLEVGIGDGENLPLLPALWTVFGLDIARTRLSACLKRFPEMAGKLAWAEAEEIPFPDATFDACFSVGGFNYFRDHDAAICEMRRVTKPGGTAVIADERPDLIKFGLGHLIGWKAYDKWWMRRVGMPEEFIEMVLACDLNLDDLLARTWPEAKKLSIWRSLGYCLVQNSSDGRTG